MIRRTDRTFLLYQAAASGFTGLAAQATRTSLEREIATASLVIAKHLSDVATARTALEAMSVRMADRNSALAREVEAHQATKALLERAIAAVEQRSGTGAGSVPGAKAAKRRVGN